jgi:Tfp pilus assembly protein PilF
MVRTTTWPSSCLTPSSTSSRTSSKPGTDAVYYTKKDFGRALADIHEVLAREPRHFGALSGLGIILQELGDEKHALEVFRRALAIHPHLERVPDLVKKLTDKVDGRDI